MILSREAIAKTLNSQIFPGIQGGPLEHVIAAKAVAFGEALRPEFKRYQQAIIDNAQALAEGLTAGGLRLVSGGTDNHLMLVDLRPKGLNGKVAEEALGKAGITVNKNMIPWDPEKPFVTSGIRVGSPALTTRGMGAAEMATVAKLIVRVLDAPADEASLARVRGEVRELCAQFPMYEELLGTKRGEGRRSGARGSPPRRSGWPRGSPQPGSPRRSRAPRRRARGRRRGRRGVRRSRRGAMRCPFCDHPEDKVVDSREAQDGRATRRRRECLACGRRFTTYERIDEILPQIVKKDGRRETYDREKIVKGLEIACQKRPVSREQIEALVGAVERQLQEVGDREVRSSVIGETVMARLKELDPVAYVRFASVYREFRDVKDFVSELAGLDGKGPRDGGGGAR